MTEFRHLTRRDFMRDGALGALALGAGIALPRHASAADAKSLVAIVRDERVQSDQNTVDPAALKKMLDETVKIATGESTGAAGWKKLVKPDDVVGLVSTNHLNKTHPEVVEAVREALLAAGVPADNVRAVQGKTAEAETCTALIALPALKAHWFTGIGTVLKNYITFSGKASTYHNAGSVNLGEIWLLPVVKGKTRLVIVDALRPLFAQGPQVNPQYLWNYNGLIAGADPIAVETLALRIIQAKRHAFRNEPWELTPPPLCVAAADEKFHLGTSDPAKIDIKTAGWEKDLLVQA